MGWLAGHHHHIQQTMQRRYERKSSNGFLLFDIALCLLRFFRFFFCSRCSILVVHLHARWLLMRCLIRFLWKNPLKNSLYVGLHGVFCFLHGFFLSFLASVILHTIRFNLIYVFFDEGFLWRIELSWLRGTLFATSFLYMILRWLEAGIGWSLLMKPYGVQCIAALALVIHPTVLITTNRFQWTDALGWFWLCGQ